MIIFYSADIDHARATLIGDECIHCAKVLRKKVGDQVYITDGLGKLYSGSIDAISKKEVDISIEKEVEDQPKKHRRAIAIAPTKNIDRFEWFLEKSTEIGITEVYPFVSTNSERKVIKPARLEKIILSAVKQSKNFHKPILHPITRLQDILIAEYGESKKFIAHCMDPTLHLNAKYPSGKDAIVLIGPEGDFTAQEVSSAKNNGWEDVTLGESRLRTETAGIIACHLLNL